MNLFEKEKFLKFCDKSVAKIPNIVYDFRYQMSFNPYNVYYLPILAPADDLIDWEKSETKEVFIQNCRANMDEWSYSALNKFNNHYISEFISTAAQSESQNVMNLAKKLQHYTTSNDEQQHFKATYGGPGLGSNVGS